MLRYSTRSERPGYPPAGVVGAGGADKEHSLAQDSWPSWQPASWGTALVQVEEFSLSVTIGAGLRFSRRCSAVSATVVRAVVWEPSWLQEAPPDA